MRTRIIILTLLAVYISSTAKVKDNETEKQLVLTCRQITQQTDSIDSLSTVLNKLQTDLKDAKLKWKTTCQKYMKSRHQCKEDYAYLIANTDSIREKELLSLLKKACDDLDDGKVSKNESSATVPNKETGEENVDVKILIQQ